MDVEVECVTCTNGIVSMPPEMQIWYLNGWKPMCSNCLDKQLNIIMQDPRAAAVAGRATKAIEISYQPWKVLFINALYITAIVASTAAFIFFLQWYL